MRKTSAAGRIVMYTLELLSVGAGWGRGRQRESSRGKGRGDEEDGNARDVDVQGREARERGMKGVCCLYCVAVGRRRQVSDRPEGLASE
jgi:hypothetical protein